MVRALVLQYKASGSSPALVYAPINVKPQGGGGGQTQGNLTF